MSQISRATKTRWLLCSLMAIMLSVIIVGSFWRTGPSITLDEHAGVIWAVAFAPDGTLLASACEDGTVRIRDARNWVVRARLHEHRSAVTSLAFLPNSHQLVSADTGGTIVCWNTNTWLTAKRINEKQGGVA